tara:strand:+ start:658 stop:819 length:162 start_codon:yes stop_codon:yes gene_type:complete
MNEWDEIFKLKHWEHIPDEDLFEDGELKIDEVFDKINYHIFVKGDWTLIRRKR